MSVTNRSVLGHRRMRPLDCFQYSKSSKASSYLWHSYPREPPCTAHVNTFLRRKPLGRGEYTKVHAQQNGGNAKPKRSIALRRTLYTPAAIVFGSCILKVVAFGMKPYGIFMTCTMLGFSVPFGPHTLWNTIPMCALVGLLLWWTSRFELDNIARALIAICGFATLLVSWKMQGPIPALPRRIPKYIQDKMEQSHEIQRFKELSVQKQAPPGYRKPKE